ncbi:hypothetical protein IVB03_27915 [Bradyrhizobium sp. 168]|uniref:hypothetical protein n=1 Tax=Bradyrhizobium sp. 168 TaxID=2782639 RepID=UPI001FF7E073|nr:hypothetical protein [Bradyrhizobium sp. 168]MCK1583286.1 hypothetical protein [Bradyrhizobium sp. 168]
MILFGVGLIALAIVLLITSPLLSTGADLGIVVGLLGLAVLVTGVVMRLAMLVI